MRSLFFSFLLLLIVPTLHSYATIRLPRLISDGMVLQRDKEIPVWGWASPGEKVSITFNGKNYSTVTAANGKWSLKLPPLKAGGPYAMTITGSNRIEIRDILIGDVWICSGQSNMALQLSKVRGNYTEMLRTAANPHIRQFLPDRKYSFDSLLEDTEAPGWLPADPKTIQDFTAVGYFFARELYEKYKVPIGLINNSWGGTPAEGWMSEEALKPFASYTKEIAKLKDTAYVQGIVKKDRAVLDDWYNELLRNDEGKADAAGHSWADANIDTTAWRQVTMPDNWDAQGIKYVHGVVWLRKSFTVPASLTGKEATLYLGNITNEDTTYVNGVKVGFTSDKNKVRKYTVPAQLLRPGVNTIAVRVLNSEGMGGFLANRPYKLVIDRETIDLSGSWLARVGANGKLAPRGTLFQYKPGVLYRGMLYPLLPYAIKGVIWYQGEANAEKAKEYQSLFKTLITDWRSRWGQGDFPFLFVQLANFKAVVDSPSESSWAALREAQAMALSLPNTGMAVTLDIGEAGDIHPKNKYDVGRRLALAAMKIAYGERDMEYSGPVVQSVKKQGQKVVISFTHTESGLIAKGGGELKYFSLAGADGKFAWARAAIEGNTVVVWNDAIPNPVSVRYAWADNPDGANLFNKEGLPASSFRYDNLQNH